MGIIRLRDYPNEQLKFKPLNVIEDPIKISIHLVRIYKDNKTVLSVICLTIGNQKSYYTSITRNNNNLALEGDYYGYMVSRRDGKTSKRDVDKISTTKDIQEILVNLKKYDTRLHKKYYKGGTAKNHNGLRIFQKGIVQHKTKKGKYILDGGNRYFHFGRSYRGSNGCELIDKTACYTDFTSSSGVMQKNCFLTKGDGKGTYDFLSKIIEVYDKNVHKIIDGEKKVKDKSEQSRIEIDIRIDFKIDNEFKKTLKKRENIDPEKIYKRIYQNK